MRSGLKMKLVGLRHTEPVKRLRCGGGGAIVREKDGNRTRSTG